MARAIPLSYSVRSAFQRRTRTALTVAVIALVVLAVTLMMSLVSGIRRTLVATGEPDNFIVLRKGATNDGARPAQLTTRNGARDRGEAR